MTEIQFEPGERNARAYCRSIGADPDAPVIGWLTESAGFGRRRRYSAVQPRWRWYLGARVPAPHVVGA